ncbi:MAG: hypothetical protein M1411_06930 [Candidatus Thermoplasmatota archaeon]|nr:hypothetical protein [Candidatus Thermoplasmatota archaeon]
MVVKGRSGKSFYCMKCKHETTADSKKCSNCNASFNDIIEVKVCPSCGNIYKDAISICPRCNAKYESPKKKGLFDKLNPFQYKETESDKVDVRTDKVVSREKLNNNEKKNQIKDSKEVKNSEVTGTASGTTTSYGTVPPVLSTPTGSTDDDSPPHNIAKEVDKHHTDKEKSTKTENIHNIDAAIQNTEIRKDEIVNPPFYNEELKIIGEELKDIDDLDREDSAINKDIKPDSNNINEELSLNQLLDWAKSKNKDLDEEVNQSIERKRKFILDYIFSKLNEIIVKKVEAINIFYNVSDDYKIELNKKIMEISTIATHSNDDVEETLKKIIDEYGNFLSLEGTILKNRKKDMDKEIENLKNINSELKSRLEYYENLERDTGRVLLILDKLLDSLPDDKIAEFSEKEEFQIYLKILKKFEGS